MKHVVMFSGGLGSWACARRVIAQCGPQAVTLLFTDTLTEDEDLYRFLDDASAQLGAQLIKISEGRSVWEVLFAKRMMGGSGGPDPCSRILKRELADKWLEENCDPTDTRVYVGIDWSEIHRFERLRPRKAKKGWAYFAPMTEPPYQMKADMMADLLACGIEAPRLYGMGFEHNNCGGFCVKAGISHFRHLLQVMPERYAYHEAKEQEFRMMIDKDVAILKDRRGGVTKPLTLKALRERIERGTHVEQFDFGGCGCFSDDEEQT